MFETILLRKILKGAIIPFLIIVIFISGWYCGSVNKNNEWVSKNLAVENSHLELSLKQADASIKTVEKFNDKVTDIKSNSTIIIKKVPVYVTKENDATCIIHDNFRVHWNAANKGVLPTDTPASKSNETPSDIKLSDVATQHAVESETCKQTEAQLIALQEWVRNTTLPSISHE